MVTVRQSTGARSLGQRPMLNLANSITLFRIFLVPALALMMLEGHHVWAVAVFAVAAVTDALDGIIARHWNQRTTLGAILDPLADKMMLVTAVVLLGLEESPYFSFPLWLVVAVVFRDVEIMLGVLLIHVHTGSVKWGPSWLSKGNTVAQILAVLTAMLGNALIQMGVEGGALSALRSALPVMIGIALVTTVSSCVDYTLRGMRHLGETEALPPAATDDKSD